MEDATIEASLNSMIDPALQGQSPTFPAPEPVDASLSPSPLGPVQRTKRKGGIVRGSAADFRRREANRLAADRSRSRAHEKHSGLERAARTLGEENIRLKAEIAKLERSDPDPPQTQSQQITTSHPVGVGVGVGAGVGLSEHDISLSSGNDAQDSHSRTILAALMSGAVDQAFGTATEEGDDSWMQGVEDMFKEAESNGRLDELADVAAGRNDDEDGDEGEHQIGILDLNQGHQESADGGGAEGHETKVGVQTQSGGSGTGLPSRELKRLEYDPTAAAAETASAMAVAINAEMEKLLRDDLATTKAAIARVEREIARLKQDPKLEDTSAADTDERKGDQHSSLPDGILTTDTETIRTESTNAQERITKIEGELPALRDTVTRMKDAKVEEEGKLASVVGELQILGMSETEQEKKKITVILKAVGGYVGKLLGDIEAGSSAGASIAGPYSSPAIARRRRGRPPKTATLQTYQQHPTQTSSHARAQSGYAKGRSRSRLTNEVLPDSTGVADVAQLAEERSHPGQHLEASHETGHEAEHTHDDEADTAEQYILSHLRDSSSFADFLPHTEEHLASLQQSHHDNGDDHSAHDGLDTPAEDEAVLDNEGDDAALPATPSVLSRLKKGAPGSCDICGRTETSVWRKLTLGGQDHKVCNACGLYHTKFGVIRPPELWGDGRSLKKRRVTSRPSLGVDEHGNPRKKRKATRTSGDLPKPEGSPAELHKLGDDRESGEGGVAEGESAEVEGVATAEGDEVRDTMSGGNVAGVEIGEVEAGLEALRQESMASMLQMDAA